MVNVSKFDLVVIMLRFVLFRQMLESAQGARVTEVSSAECRGNARTRAKQQIVSVVCTDATRPPMSLIWTRCDVMVAMGMTQALHLPQTTGTMTMTRIAYRR